MNAKNDKNGLLVGVNEVTDFSNLSDLEKKHIPVINAPDSVKQGQPFEVDIEVGKMMEHPHEEKHFIQMLDVYADDTFLARADFTAAMTLPKVRFCLTLQHPANELLAYEHCNLHGTWVGRKPVSVEDG